MKKKGLLKSILAIVLTLAMVLGAVPLQGIVLSARADGLDGTSSETAMVIGADGDGWKTLVDALSGELGMMKRTDVTEDADHPTYLKLESDCVSPNPESSGPIEVASGRYVVLDLNGHTIDRGLGDSNEGAANGNVITVNGNLTLKDSGTNGTITGGKYFNGDDSYGGGVIVNGTFTMEGGKITGCQSAQSGGGVYVAENGTFTMKGGTITECYAVSDGGGVYSEGTFNVSGAPVIKGNNTQYTERTGVDLANDKKIGIIGALRNGAEIWVITNENDTFAAGLGYDITEADAAYFHSDAGDNYVAVLRNGGIKFEQAYAIKVDEYIYHGTITASPTTAAAAGATVTLTITPDTGYVLDTLTVTDGNYNSINVSGTGNTRTFTMPAEDVTVDASFAEAVAQVGDVKYSTVQGAIDAAPANGTVTLLSDVTISSPLNIESGKTVTIDLNGHTIDRGLGNGNEGAANGNVITVNGNLTLKDSGTDGTITGGHNFNNGGGVYNNGTFTMTGGSITGNTSNDEGGGVCNNNDSTFIMTGGNINGNAAKAGGGVYNNGTFTMTGGSITGNTANQEGGGVYNANGSTFTMTGGNINGNAANAGGGVYNYSTFTMTGGSITENTATGEDCYGGGVVNYMATFNVSGRPVISGNNANNTSDNVRFGNNPINVIGALDSNAEIHVKVTNKGQIVAKGSGGYQPTASDAAKFVCDNESYAPLLDSTHNTIKMTQAYTITVADGISNGTVTAPARAATGATVTLTVTPGEGYVLDTLTVTDEGSGECTVSGTGSTRTFTMPSNNVTVTADFEEPVAKAGDDKYTTVQGAINAAPANGTVTLLSDVTISSPLNIESGKTVTLDLNGHTIDRGLGGETAASNGYVIEVQGNLTLTDGSTAKNGKITGGNDANGLGGGVYVNGGTFTMQGGTIIGNQSSTGGGVYVAEAGTFNMSGGSIIGNNASGHGGGATISEGCTFNVSGCPDIKDNWTEGIWDGDAKKYVINSNMDSSVKDDVQLGSISTYITVSGALTSGANIYVTVSGPRVVAQKATGLSETEAGRFHSDDSDYTPALSSDGNVVFKAQAAFTSLPQEASGLIYSGEEQELLTDYGDAPTTVKVAVTTDNSATEPAGLTYGDSAGATEAGTYYIWYYAEDTEHYVGTTPARLGPVTIAPCPITVTGITAEEKPYDGTTEATLDTSGATLYGKCDGDDLTVSATGTFDNKNAGDGKTVTISDITLGGADADNYVLADSGNQETTTANITKATPTVTAPVAKTDLVYSGSGQALVTTGSVPTGCEMKYALTDNTETTAPAENSNWSATAPEGTNAGSYKVWYKVDGGNNYEDVAASFVTVAIEKADQAAPALSGEFTVPTGSETVVITGVDATMEYSTDNKSWTACEATLSLGKGVYYVRKQADANHKVGAAATIVVKREGEHTFTVIGGTGTGSYVADETVTVTATAPAGEKFKDWSATGITLTEEEKVSPKLTITMPASDASLAANFEDLVVESLSLNKTATKLEIGKKESLTVSFNPATVKDSYKNVVWSSDNEGVASVDDKGNVTAIKEGKATITVKSAFDESIKATCEVTVEKAASIGGGTGGGAAGGGSSDTPADNTNPSDSERTSDDQTIDVTKDPSEGKVAAGEAETSTVTGKDGSVTETTKVENTDGSTTVKEKVTTTDGTVSEKTTVIEQDGTVKTQETIEKENGSKTEKATEVKANGDFEAKTVTTNKDGEVTKTVTEVRTTNEKTGKVTLETETVKASGATQTTKAINDAKGNLAKASITETTAEGKTTAIDFKTNKSGTVVVKNIDSDQTTVTIPAKVADANGKNHPVKVITSYALKGETAVTTLVVNKNVKTFEKNALSGSSVKTLKLDSVPRFEKNSLNTGRKLTIVVHSKKQARKVKDQLAFAGAPKAIVKIK
ncbi:MAG: hypothetical protein E7280_10675 [Lachnospiraceae bacterium]|nr:hypothetical protein [Lachnospiraceae bacterium]